MEQQVQVTIRSDPAFLGIIRSAVSRMASRAGLPPDTIDELALGVEEAVLWIIDHAFPPDTEGEITLTCSRPSMPCRVTAISPLTRATGLCTPFPP